MNVNWWKAAGIRAVKTFFQTFAATLGSAAVLESVNWKVVISASAMAASHERIETLFKYHDDHEKRLTDLEVESK